MDFLIFLNLLIFLSAVREGVRGVWGAEPPSEAPQAKDLNEKGVGF